MKRNTLTTAVLAGLTGLAGMVSVSNAVNVNPDGLGQVLLYPYYTTRGGNDTLISVVNTTSRGKAVKIRFIEALNSREVFDFNIYMSEWDVWTAAITDTGAGAGLVIADTTCTVPYFVGDAGGPGSVAIEHFVDYLYTGPAPGAGFTANDGGPQSLDRTRSGYIEVIEMGVLGVDSADPNNVEDVEAAARHRTNPVTDAAGNPIKGTPGPSGSTGSNANIPCGLFQERWISNDFTNGNGIWRDSPPIGDTKRGIYPATGGLFGNAAILNVEKGTMFGYEATALDNFWDPTQQLVHTEPEDPNPSLASSSNRTSTVFISGMAAPQSATWFDSIEPVNHVLAVNAVMNEYNINPGLAASSEWVITFPTKRLHVDAAANGAIQGAVNPIPPFTDLWTFSAPYSCDLVPIAIWDREEQPVTDAGEEGAGCPSPRPIDPDTGLPIPCVGFGGDGQVLGLCRESNVIRFGRDDTPAPGTSEIFGEFSAAETLRPQYSYINIPLPQSPYPWLEGWAKLSFAGFYSQLSTDNRRSEGLPAIGFWANTFTNDSVSDGVLANFGAAFRHRGSRMPLQIDSGD